MPVSYQFTDRATGQAVTLSQVDEEVCAFYDVTPDKDEYCMAFTALTWTGIACAKGDDGEVTAEALDEIFKEPDSGDDRYQELCRLMLLQKYKFTAWRSWR